MAHSVGLGRRVWSMRLPQPPAQMIRTGFEMKIAARRVDDQAQAEALSVVIVDVAHAEVVAASLHPVDKALGLARSALLPILTWPNMTWEEALARAQAGR